MIVVTLVVLIFGFVAWCGWADVMGEVHSHTARAAISATLMVGVIAALIALGGFVHLEITGELDIPVWTLTSFWVAVAILLPLGILAGTKLLIINT